MKIWGKLKDFWIQCRRVLRVTKKPDKQEFLTIVKVSGLGILVIGLIGFILSFIKQIILG
ncbi:protein translocase SEC61 complex subunit gamma [Candidatus Woesearchaeota archaeon]|nr:protein translocase SEC61 complex subunit gamma [Candidatus Woesearchaeota archaeon]